MPCANPRRRRGRGSLRAAPPSQSRGTHARHRSGRQAPPGISFLALVARCSPGCPGSRSLAQAGLELADTRRLRLPGAGMGGVVYAPGSRWQTHTPWPATHREILPSATSRRRSRGCPPLSLWWKSLDSGVRRRQHTAGRGGLAGACPWLRAGAVSVRGSYFLHLSPSGADAVLAAARMRGCARAAAPWTTRRRRTGCGRSARPSCRRVARGGGGRGAALLPIPLPQLPGGRPRASAAAPGPGERVETGRPRAQPGSGCEPGRGGPDAGSGPRAYGTRRENTRIQTKPLWPARGGRRQPGLRPFGANPVSTVGSRTARALQPGPVSRNQNKQRVTTSRSEPGGGGARL